MFAMRPFRRRGHRMPGPPWHMLFDDFGIDGEFKADIKETENEHIIQAELPGIKKENINVELDDNCLTISASNQEINEKEEENYIRRERKTGNYSRSFYLPNMKEDDITASFHEGLLEVKIPKENPGKKSRSINIQ